MFVIWPLHGWRKFQEDRRAQWPALRELPVSHWDGAEQRDSVRGCAAQSSDESQKPAFAFIMTVTEALLRASQPGPERTVESQQDVIQVPPLPFTGCITMHHPAFANFHVFICRMKTKSALPHTALILK